jgi:hypothetical protein
MDDRRTAKIPHVFARDAATAAAGWNDGKAFHGSHPLEQLKF